MLDRTAGRRSRAELVAGHVGAVNWHAVRLYRLSRRLWLANRRALAVIVATVNRVLTGVEIPPSASFGPGLVIMHGLGIVVHPRTRAGRDCTLYQHTTIGSRTIEGDPPTLGDRVTLFPGAAVLGDITLGDDSVVAANAVVICDVPVGATARGPVATVT
jgi:serine O-acetyltransferase